MKYITFQENNFKENESFIFFLQYDDNEENLKLHGLKHKLAIEAICNQHNIKFITLTLNQFVLLDFARDLAHSGVKSSKRFADKVLGYIN